VLILEIVKVVCFVALLQVLILKGVIERRGASHKTPKQTDEGTPHPGCSAKRVWICLIPKELTFLRATKRRQEYRNKGVSLVGKGPGRITCRANMAESITLVYRLSSGFFLWGNGWYTETVLGSLKWKSQFEMPVGGFDNIQFQTEG
jgi:hypothetical protein